MSWILIVLLLQLWALYYILLCLWYDWSNHFPTRQCSYFWTSLLNFGYLYPLSDNCVVDVVGWLVFSPCQPAFFCFYRHFETQNLSVYIRHLKTIHSKRKEVLCDQCGMSFNRQDALRSHKNAVHGNGVKKPYICELCEKAFRCNVSNSRSD